MSERIRSGTAATRGQTADGGDYEPLPVPFIIFSLARCGSTTLTHVLNCHPGSKCVIEPFTPSNESTKYRCIKDADALDRALAELWREYNGIKHVWDPTGFPFGDSLELNRRLLRNRVVRVIFLVRRNNLRRIISDEISWQTQVWGTFTNEDQERVRHFYYQPLRIDRIEWQLRADSEAVPAMRQMLDDAQIDFLSLYYEDVFGAHLDLPGRLAVIDEIRAFIGAVGATDDKVRHAVLSLLDPEKGKLNSLDTYMRLPNIRQIEERFGSDESGWLFNAGPGFA
jgi:hypothetical protein